MNNFNVVIVGGGAAGLYVAGLLGKGASGICLLDSKEDILNVSFHTLGSFIDRDRFRLSKKIVAADITECVLHSKHAQVTKKGIAYILHKEQVHKELLECALANGVTIKNPVRIREFKKADDGTIDHLIDIFGNEYRGKIFIDASGVAGILSRPLGLQDQKFKIAVGLEYNVKYFGPQNQVHLFIGKRFRGGYGWIFPLGNGRAIFGYGTFAEKEIARLKNTVNGIITAPPINKLIEKDNNQSYGGTIPITNVKNKFVFKNVVCIGDSISQVHPLIGEGYRFVLESGKMAAPHILNTLKQNDLRLLAGYEDDWNEKFLASYRKGKLIQNTLKFVSYSDIISDLVLFLISKLKNDTFMKLLAGNV